MILEKAYRPIDNAPLILFRIALGALIMAESFVAILTGWVKKNLIDPTVHLPHIGFDFLIPLPGILCRDPDNKLCLREDLKLI